MRMVDQEDPALWLVIDLLWISPGMQCLRDAQMSLPNNSFTISFDTLNNNKKTKLLQSNNMDFPSHVIHFHSISTYIVF